MSRRASMSKPHPMGEFEVSISFYYTEDGNSRAVIVVNAGGGMSAGHMAHDKARRIIDDVCDTLIDGLSR